VVTFGLRVIVLLWTKMDDKKVVLDSASSAEVENGAVEATVYDEKATKKLVRKIDWVLIPWLAFLYLWVSYSFFMATLIVTD
jgi:hypothetical protein